MKILKKYTSIWLSTSNYKRKFLRGTIISAVFSLLLWGAIYSYAIINKEITLFNNSEQSITIISGFLILSAGTIITIYSLIKNLKN